MYLSLKIKKFGFVLKLRELQNIEKAPDSSRARRLQTYQFKYTILL